MSTPAYPHPIIAREGWAFVALALLIAAALTWAGPWWLAALAWLVALFIVQFFRDPPRVAPEMANAVLSPADGKIVLVERTRDPYLDRDALKISVFMNVFAVHSNRSPVDAVVKNSIGRRLGITGPIESADLGGLDTMFRFAEFLQPTLDTSSSPPSVVGERRCSADPHIHGRSNVEWSELSAARKEELFRWLARDRDRNTA